jgi:hypothetical protein
LINKSSRAKPAMAKIMNKMPLKFSIPFSLSELHLNFNGSYDLWNNKEPFY